MKNKTKIMTIAVAMVLAATLLAAPTAARIGSIQNISSGDTIFVYEEGLNLSNLCTGIVTSLNKYSDDDPESSLLNQIPVSDAGNFDVLSAAVNSEYGIYFAWNGTAVGDIVVIREPVIDLDVAPASSPLESLDGTSVTRETNITFAIESPYVGAYYNVGDISDFAQVRVEVTAPGGGTTTLFEGVDLTGIDLSATRIYTDTISLTTAEAGTHTARAKWALPDGFKNYATNSNTISFTVLDDLPTADFTANSTSGEAPLTVQFNDTTSGDPTAWEWNFGDGSPNATVQNPVHTYNISGTYDVILTATNVAGSDTETKAGYINVTDAATPPTADFSANNTSGQAPLTVQFNDTSTGDPTTWNWSFGDGTPNATVQNPIHVYNISGIYNVTLTATNAAGDDTETKAAYINVTDSPLPSGSNLTLDVSGLEPYYIGDTVTLHGNNTASQSTYLFLTGPGLPVNGAPLEDIYTASQTGVNTTFAVAEVAANGTWEFAWDTAGLGLDWDTAYTIHAVEAPLALEDIGGAAAANQTATFLYPYVSAMPSASTIQPGDPLTITGTATGSPDNGVAIWIFGTNFYTLDTETVAENRTFQYDIDGNYTSLMSDGEYSVIIEHPMLNGMFDAVVVPGGATYGGVTVPVGNTYVMDASANYFVIEGPGSLPSLDARDALAHMLGTSGDDDRTYFPFSVDSGEPPFEDVPGGPVTITAGGNTSFNLGDEILLSGVNSESATTCLFLVGDNLPVAGGNLQDPRISVVDSDNTTFVEVQVEADDTWEYAWDTAGIGIDPGNYTVYAAAEPHDRFNLGEVEYATQTLDMARPAVFAPLEIYVASGDVCDIVGYATGQPFGVQVWIISDDFRLAMTETVWDDGFYDFVLETPGMATGQYDVIVQHPMMNDVLDVIEVPGGFTYNGVTVPEGSTYVVDASGNYFVYSGPGKLYGDAAVAALENMLNSPYIDDDCTWSTLTIEDPWLALDPVGNYTVGEIVHIEGTTNLAAGSDIPIEIETAGDHIPVASGPATVQPDTPYNTFSFDVDTTEYLPGEYDIIANRLGYVEDFTSFWLIQPNPPPSADFVADVLTTYAPHTVQFTDTSTGDPDTWAWDFGDGAVSADQHPAHTYTNMPVPGPTPLPGGRVATSGDTIFVHETKLSLEALRSDPGSSVVSLRKFVNDDPEKALIHQIGVADDTNMNLLEEAVAGEYGVYYPADAAGNLTERTYTVNLTAENPYGNDTETKSDYVTVKNVLLIREPVLALDVTFDGSPGESMDGKEVTVSDLLAFELICPYLHPAAQASIDITTPGGAHISSMGGVDLENINLTDTLTSIGVISPEGMETGTYTATAQWTGPEGFASGAPGSNTVVFTLTEAPPQADFTVDQTSGEAPLAVNFTDTSVGIPTAWEWDFGDEEGSYDQNPAHTYTVPGVYDVELHVSNQNGADTLLEEELVRVYAKQYALDFTVTGISASMVGGKQHIVIDNATCTGSVEISGNDIVITGLDGSFQQIVYHFESLSVDGDQLSGNLTSAEVTTRTFNADISGIGSVAPYFTMNFNTIPPGGTLNVGILDTEAASVMSGFEVLAGENGQVLDSSGYFIEVTTENFGTALNEANVYFTVPTTWTDGYTADEITVFRRNNAGASSVLTTTLIDASPSANTYCGSSPDGFSTFGIVGLKPVPGQPAPEEPAPVSPVSPSTSPGGSSPSPPSYSPPEAQPEVPAEAAEGGEEVYQDTTDTNSGTDDTEGDQGSTDGSAGSSEDGGSAGEDQGTYFEKLGTAWKTATETNLKLSPIAQAVPDEVAPVAAVATGVGVAGVGAALSGSAASAVQGSLGSSGAAGSSGGSGTSGGMRSGGLTSRAGALRDMARTMPIARNLVEVEEVVRRVPEQMRATMRKPTIANKLRRFTEFIRKLVTFEILGVFSLKEVRFNNIKPIIRKPIFFGFSLLEITVALSSALIFGIAFLFAGRLNVEILDLVLFLLMGGIAVIGHEMITDMFARQNSCTSEFQFWSLGTIVLFVNAGIFGLAFGKPSRTVMEGVGNLKPHYAGTLMLIGPLVNVIFAMISLFMIPLGGILGAAGAVGFPINLLLSVYTLIPVNPMKGKIVYDWSKIVWGVFFIPLVTLYIMVYFLT